VRALRQPGLTLTAVLVLGVALGAATVVFGTIDAVLLRPLPYREPERLVTVWNRPQVPGAPLAEISLGEARAWQARSRSFTELALTTQPTETTLTGPGTPERVRFRIVTTNFFSLLGVEAALGRTFAPGLDDPPETRTAILSDSFWRRRLNADPGLLGRRIEIAGEPFTVVGVLPPSLPFPRGTDVFVPLAVFQPQAPADQETLRIFQGVGRLVPGVTPDQAAAELTRISKDLRRPSLEVARVTPLPREILDAGRSALWLIAGGVGLLLLIACANVAGLLLAGAVARRREMALRAALGAGQGRLIGQILTESLLLAALASGLALGIAGLGLRLVARLGVLDLPRLDLAALDSRAVAFTCTAALLGVALFGFLPAFEAVSADLGEALRESDRSTGGARVRRVRDLLVSGETALALAVLILAGLTGRSFLALWRADLGFAPAGRLTFTLEVDPKLSAAQQGALFREILESLRRVPDAQAAGLILLRPLASPIGWDYTITLPGQTDAERTVNPIVNHERISPGLFAALGIPVLEGRDFAWSDTAEAPRVAIVSRAAAGLLWPGRSPLGQRLRWRSAGSPWMTVVGVVGDVRYREIEGVRPDVYVPFQQDPISQMDVVLRTAVPAEEMGRRAREAVHAFDPQLLVGRLEPLEEAVAAARARPRLRALVLAAFAGLSLVLAAVGLYGSVAWSVAQRRRELAIRHALGAGRGALLRLTLGRALASVAAGLAAGLLVYGLVLAQPETRHWLAGLLYETGPGDPAVLLGAPLFLLAVTLLAGLLSVRRALRPDAAEVLRAE
jgi:predicted permease